MKLGLLLTAVAAACSAPAEMNSEPAVLTGVVPEARLTIPRPGDDRIVIDVVKVDNPRREGVLLTVSTPGGRPIGNFSLYPPDQPAAFKVRLPADAQELVLRLAATRADPSIRIEVRLRTNAAR